MHLQSGKEQLDSDFEDEFTKKRDAKLSQKKSDLYMKIMKEHGFSTEDVVQKTSSQSKLSYVIPTLNIHQPALDSIEEKKRKSLTIQKPFDLQTAKRTRILNE